MKKVINLESLISEMIEVMHCTREYAIMILESMAEASNSSGVNLFASMKQ